MWPNHNLAKVIAGHNLYLCAESYYLAFFSLLQYLDDRT